MLYRDIVLTEEIRIFNTIPAGMENVSGYYNTSNGRYELIVAPVFANQTLEYYFTCLETESGPQFDTQKYVYAKH